MALHRKMLFLLFLASAVMMAGCLGGWSQTSWQVPLAIRLLDETITMEDILGDLAADGLVFPDGEPVALDVTETFHIEPDIHLDIPDFAASGSYPELVPSAAFEAQGAAYAVTIEVPLADLFAVDGFDVHGATMAAARLDVRVERAQVYLVESNDLTVIDVVLIQDHESLSVWDANEQQVILDGITVYPADRLAFTVAADEPAPAFSWQVTGTGFQVAEAWVSFSDEVILDQDPIDLGLVDSERMQQLFAAITALEIQLAVELTNTTGATISGYDTLELHFHGEETHTLPISDGFVAEGPTSTVITIPSDILWPYIQRLPQTMELMGSLTIGGTEQRLLFTENRLDGAVEAVASLDLQMHFSADFAAVEPFFTDAARIEADPDSAADMDELGDLSLWVEVANDLPVGVEVFLELATDSTFPEEDTDYIPLGRIPPAGLSDPLTIAVDEPLRDLLRNGGYLRARLLVEGAGHMVVRGDDTVRLRAWVEARVNVRFDNGDDK